MTTVSPVQLPPYLWPKQRKKCDQCANVRTHGTAMRCAAGKTRAGNGSSLRPYCIEMRTDGPCGAGAALFESAR